MPDSKPPHHPGPPRPARPAHDSAPSHGARRESSDPGATPPSNSPWSSARPKSTTGRTAPEAAVRQPRGDEQRLYGLNACLAAFAARPGALRKVWLREDRIPRLKAVLAWCVQQRVGYRVVADTDLEKLSGSEHHEGVVFALARRAEPGLGEWLQSLPAGPCIALWLAGVGNPHNLGAILRSAAHFGVAGLLLDSGDALALSGAACRIAEGGAEAVPLVRLPAPKAALAQLHGAGFATAATVVRGGESVFSARLPQRLVLVMGAEGEGLSAAQASAFDQRLGIPGSGAVESLNVAAATAVFLAEWVRQRG